MCHTSKVHDNFVIAQHPTNGYMLTTILSTNLFNIIALNVCDDLGG